MAIIPVTSQPSGYIKTINKDGVEVVTDFKIIEASFSPYPPIYKMEKVCPNCSHDEFLYLGDKVCIRCGYHLINLIKLEEDDDAADNVIESRFDILDL